MSKTNYFKRFFTFFLAIIMALTNFTLSGIQANAISIPTSPQITNSMWVWSTTGHYTYLWSTGGGHLETSTLYASVTIPNLSNLPAELRGKSVTNRAYCTDASLASPPSYGTSASVSEYSVNKTLYYILYNGARANNAWNAVGQSAPYTDAAYNSAYRLNHSVYDGYITQGAVRGVTDYGDAFINGLYGNDSMAQKCKSLYWDAKAFANNPNTKTGSYVETVIYDANNNPITSVDVMNLYSYQGGRWSLYTGKTIADNSNMTEDDGKVEWKYTTDHAITGYGEGVECFTTASTPFRFDGTSSKGFQAVFSSPYFGGNGVLSNYDPYDPETPIKIYHSVSGRYELLEDISDLKPQEAFYMVVPSDQVQDYMINNGKSKFFVNVSGSISNQNTPTKLSVAYRSLHNRGYGQRMMTFIEAIFNDPTVYGPEDANGGAVLKVGFVWVQKKLDTSNILDTAESPLASNIEQRGLDGYQFRLVDPNGTTRYTGTTDESGMVKFNAVVPGPYTLEEVTYGEYTSPVGMSGDVVIGSPTTGKITVQAGVKEEVTQTNEMRFIDLTVKKYAEDQKYDDIRFHLDGTTDAFYTENHMFYIPAMTVDEDFPPLNENHETTITGLLPGTYTVSESTPSRYVTVEEKTFRLDYNSNKVQTIVTKYDVDYVLEDNANPDHGFTNLVKRIQIPIQKYDPEMVDESVAQNPRNGTYYMPELNVPHSAQLSFEGAVFEIYADETITGYICDEHEHADAQTKKDCPKCEYWETGELVWTLTTNENGYATTDSNDSEQNVATNAYYYYQNSTGAKTGTAGLPAGKYHIEEAKAPEGYLRAVQRDPETNRPVDAEGNILYDLDVNGNEITDEMAQDQINYVIGTFAQDRPEAVAIEYPITWRDGEDASVSLDALTAISTTVDTDYADHSNFPNGFPNSVIKKDIEIQKQMDEDSDSADRRAGAGIRFELESTTDDRTYTVVTGSDGTAVFEDIPWGRYILRELRTPAAYTCQSCGAALTSENYASEEEIAEWKEEHGVTEDDFFGDVYIKCPVDGDIIKTTMTGNEGYELMEEMEIFVRTDDSNADGKDGYNTPLVRPIGNKLNEEWIQIVKKDDETKLNVLMPAGAVFKIYDVAKDEYMSQEVYKDGEYVLIDTFEVNSRGFLVLPEKLKPGEYELYEIKAPENYILYEDPVPFEIDGDGLVGDTGLLTDEFSGGHATVQSGPFVGISESAVDATEGIIVTFFDKPQYGKIQITKTGEGFIAETISTETIGSELNLDQEDVEIHTPVYDTVTISDAVFGIYAKEEINTYDQQVGDDGLQLIHYEKDELIQTVTTDENGVATSHELPIGSYYIKELEAPAGYVLDQTPYLADVVYAGQTELVAIDGEVAASDARQKLEIRPFVKHMETDDMFVVGMDQEIDDVWFGLFASQDMKDRDGNVIIAQDSLLDVNTVSEDGTVAFDVDLPYYQPVGDFGIDGYYYVKELKTNMKYSLDPTAYPAEFGWREDNSTMAVLTEDIQREETTVESLENKIVYGPFEFTKSDLVTDEALPNAGIRITDLNGNVYFEGYTDENGHISIAELPVGTYYYQEFDAPEGYVIDTNQYQFTIDKTPDGEVVVTKAKMSNKAIVSDLRIRKYELGTDTVLEGAGIIIKNEAGDEVFKGYTDQNGEILIKSLPYGDYTAYEFEAPEGYVLDDRIVEFSVENDGVEILLSFYDKPIEGILQLHKQDISTDESLPDTGIRITNMDTGEIVFEGYTDENGDLTIEGLTSEDGITLRAGRYQFEEFDAPEGYVLPEEKFQFEITEDGQIVKGVMTNKKITGDVLITKVDVVTSEPLPDTGIRIYDEDGNIIVEGRTDENGEFYFEELEYGKYYYQEFDAPDGYIIDENKYPFEITENDEVVKCQLENKLITGDFEFTKQDLVTDEGLPDTGVRIKNEAGEVVFEGYTDENGVIIIEDLEYGKYTYQEFDAPEGYLIDENEYPFEIKEDGEVVKAVMKNEIEKGKFELTKTDYVTSEPLPDAGIRITNRDTGELVFEGYTDENGKITLEELPYGNYSYQEFEAPEGYIIDTTPYPFAVKEDGQIIRAELDNVKETTPYTGDVNPILILGIIGAVALIGGAGYVIVNKKKKDSDQ